MQFCNRANKINRNMWSPSNSKIDTYNKNNINTKTNVKSNRDIATARVVARVVYNVDS